MTKIIKLPKCPIMGKVSDDGFISLVDGYDSTEINLGKYPSNVFQIIETCVNIGIDLDADKTVDKIIYKAVHNIGEINDDEIKIFDRWYEKEFGKKESKII